MKAYLSFCQTSMIELLVKIGNGWLQETPWCSDSWHRGIVVALRIAISAGSIPTYMFWEVAMVRLPDDVPYGNTASDCS